MVVKLISQKKGWIRILEAVIAILLLAGVLIYVTVKNQVNVQNEKLSERVQNLQNNILDGISSSASLRNATLNENFSILSEYVDSQLDGTFNYSLGVCNIGDHICSPEYPYSSGQITTLGDVFVEERIVSSTLDFYSPKILRLYVWSI